MKEIIFHPDQKYLFDLLKSGEKKVEVRAGGKGYETICVSDILLLTCISEKFPLTVQSVKKVEGFESLFDLIPFQEILPTASKEEDVIRLFESFPDYRERIKAHGFVCLYF